MINAQCVWVMDAIIVYRDKNIEKYPLVVQQGNQQISTMLTGSMSYVPGQVVLKLKT